MPYLVDTNVFLWYITGNNSLPENIRNTIESNKTNICLSMASIWELGLKNAKGLLHLEGGFPVFLQNYIYKTGIKIIPITIEHIEVSVALPFHHRDPFDRLIYAQSTVEKIKFLYTDKIFNKYRI
jgi:PIN domain nuclease of toxin-antitoxin system